MKKVRLFKNRHSIDLEREVNSFIKDKNVVSVSYSTNSVGYSVYHFCCVVYSV